MYTIEEFDVAKSKVLRYILYKKRTEKEVRLKFDKLLEENLLEDVIQELKNNQYIDDENYIQRFVNEYMALKNTSIRELSYKLYAKGLDKDKIEDYRVNHKEELEEYEIQSAKKLVIKKSYNMEEQEIKAFLQKKGFGEDSIRQALSEIGR